MINSKQMLAEDLRQILADKAEKLAGQNEKGFTDALDEVAGILGRYDPAPSPILDALDQKGQDIATYFFASYSDTRHLDNSLSAYKTVKLLVRYILLMDRYYEVGNKKYETIAKGLLRSVKKIQDGYLKYSVDLLLKRSWPFWDFEQRVKQRMIKGHTFSFKELEHYSLFKASDAPMIYAHVLHAGLPNFSPNVAAILHYNQALQDLQDDFEDIEEDVHDMMPNILIMAAAEHVPFSKIMKNQSQARKLVIGNGSLDSIVSLVERYNALVKDISVPQSFTFLKYLTRDYTNKLLSTLNVIPK